MNRRLADFIPIAVLGLLLLVPILYGLTGDPIDTSLRNSLKPPSAEFLLGSDQLGRDLLARIAHAFLLDMGLSIATVGLSLTIGAVMGVIAGELRGPVDNAVTFLMDVATALPQIIIAVVLSVHFGGGGPALVAALASTGWIKYARIIRAETLRLREAEFVAVSRTLGASRLRILVRHFLPNILPELVGLITLQFGHAILNIAALGFLGLGVQPPTPEWGSMIAEARPYIGRAPWLAIMPGLFLFTLTSLFVLSARALRRRGTHDAAGGLVAAAA